MSQSAVERKVGPSLAPRTILIVGFVVLAGYVVGIMRAMGSYDSLVAVILGPSALGKDGWMVLGLGIMAIGAARVLQGRVWQGLAIGALGAAMDLMVRPHVVALAGVALAGAGILRPSRLELRELAPVAKALSALLLLAVAFILVSKSNSFLRESGFSNPTNLNSTLNTSATDTFIGNSTFSPSSLTTWRRAPIAFLTVLFRPILPRDNHNFQSTIAAIEGTLLLLFTLLRIRWVIAALKSMRR